MIFINDAKIYAKVWSVERQENYTSLRISTSEKTKDNTYKNSNWFCKLIGHSHNSLADLKEGDRIRITKCKLTNETYVDKSGAKKSSFQFVILEASKEDQDNKSDQVASKAESSNPSPKDAPSEAGNADAVAVPRAKSDDDLPW